MKPSGAIRKTLILLKANASRKIVVARLVRSKVDDVAMVADAATKAPGLL